MSVPTLAQLTPRLAESLQLGKSGRTIKLLYEKEPIKFCTVKLYTPFGVKSFNNQWSSMTEYYIDCSVSGSESPTSIAFQKDMEQLDEQIYRIGQENPAMFPTKPGTEVNITEYSPMLRQNGTYPKLMRLQLPRDRNGNFEVFVFDENKGKVPIDTSNIESVLAKGKTFKGIIECARTWYSNGRIGSTWNLVQLKFVQPPAFTPRENDAAGNSAGDNPYSGCLIQE